MNEAKKQNQTFEVVVVGAGPFGCFAALLLAQNGVRVALCDPAPKPGQAFQHSLQTFWPTLNDPPTRAEVAHGHEMALYLNDFCRRGIDVYTSLIAPFLAAIGFSGCCSAQVLRFGTQDFEVVELNKAVALGLGLTSTPNPHSFAESSHALFFQNAANFQDSVAAALQELGVVYYCGTVTALLETSQGCQVSLRKLGVGASEAAGSGAGRGDEQESEAALQGVELRCEQVVLATAARVGDLLPLYKSILLPMTDFCVEYSCPERTDGVEPSQISEQPLPHAALVQSLAASPLAFRASSGHTSGLLAVNNHSNPFLKISGPRFLLPDAGVATDLTQHTVPPDLLQKAMAYSHRMLFSHLENNFKIRSELGLLQALNLQPTNICWSVDCLPCDELPVLGELGKLGKVLGGGGWLGSGFGAGCFAAKIICDLILYGASADLHPRLTPRRLFVGE